MIHVTLWYQVCSIHFEFVLILFTQYDQLFAKELVAKKTDIASQPHFITLLRKQIFSLLFSLQMLCKQKT